MTEFETLQKYLELKKGKYELEWKIQYDINSSNQNKFKSELQNTLDKLELLKLDLINFPDKACSISTRGAIIRQLNEYIREINSAIPGLRILRNQGLMFKDYLFAKLFKDLEIYFMFNSSGYSIPYLFYSWHESDSISREDFTQFLKYEIEELNSIENVNFVNLDKYLEGYFQRVTNSGLVK